MQQEKLTPKEKLLVISYKFIFWYLSLFKKLKP
jgi:hypothetical protein